MNKIKEGLLESDYQTLDKHVNTRRALRLEDVQDKIEKVAFDVVRFKDEDDLSKLWVIESSVDGDVIVAMYNEDDDGLERKAAWNVLSDKFANVNIFYNGEPIKKLAASTLGIPKDDVHILCRTLKRSLANDPNMRKLLLLELPAVEREAILEKYPELTK